MAKVVSAGMLEYNAARQIGSDPASSLERVTIALENARTESLIEMKRGLGLLATIGSTAPFIGLFGTVVGIINAFRGIAATGSGGMAAVSGGISEALVATALGIFVAIPAVVAFNQFTGMLERFHVEMNQASSQLVTHLFHVRQVEDINVPVKAVVSEKKMSEAKVEVAHAAR
jgi:biopolymer transport protein ExbB